MILNPFMAVAALLGKAFDRILPDKAKINEAQSRINEAEVAGGGDSVFRHWRGMLGTGLTLAFLWEVIARPVIVTYWPDAVLPPSMLKEIVTILLGMLGLS